MVIRVLFKDKSMEEYTGVFRVSNISANIDHDRLLLCFYSPKMDGSHQHTIPLSDILCWEVQPQ